MAKKKPDDDLDTTTSFADMNVDGFKWYNPNAKKQDESRKTGKKFQENLSPGESLVSHNQICPCDSVEGLA